MKTYHILNGDCLAAQFPSNIEGEIIIWRECLIEGPVQSVNFFENREVFINQNFPNSDANYQQIVVQEYHKIKDIPNESCVYFWFEHDAFCQVNFWFLLSIINNKTKKFIVYPSENGEKKWQGFAEDSSADLEHHFANAQAILDHDFVLGQQLWLAFSEKNSEKLQELSVAASMVFPYLKFICNAIVDLWNGNFDAVLQEIWQQNSKFEDTFAVVQKNYGIYGFGDSQIKIRLNKFK